MTIGRDNEKADEALALATRIIEFAAKEDANIFATALLYALAMILDQEKTKNQPDLDIEAEIDDMAQAIKETYEGMQKTTTQ